MLHKRQLVLNAVTSVIQVAIVGATFFFLYRFLLQRLGPEEFGVWSVVLATTTAGSVANLGLASGSTKYVSMYLARGNDRRVGQVIETASISVAAVMGLVLAAAYPLLRILLAFVIEDRVLVERAHLILPYSLVSFWFTSVALVFLSCTAGFQRIDLRNALQGGVALIYLLLAYLLVPSFGLLGIAQAQVIQALLLCVAAWIVIKRLSRTLPLVPFRWSRDAFKEMFGYGVNLQVISISQMLFEPTTSALLSKFGGVGSVSYYEMARRMVVQLRALFVTAHEVLVPTIADVQERDPTFVHEIYARSARLLTFLIAASLPLFIGLTPLVSLVWIGSYNATFVTFAILLFAGWFLNMAGAPAYFANMGTGELRWNVISHIVNGILNFVLGILFGWLFGGVGVVIGFVLSLVVASGLVAASYEVKYRIGIRNLIETQTALLGAFTVGGMAAMFGIYSILDEWTILSLAGLMLSAYLLLAAPPFWLHPMRSRLMQSVRAIISPNGEAARP